MSDPLKVRVIGGSELSDVGAGNCPQEEQQECLTTEPFLQPLK